MKIAKSWNLADMPEAKDVPTLSNVTFFPTGPKDDRTSHLLAHIKIGPVSMHLDAIAVKTADDGQQVAAHPKSAELLEELYKTFPVDSPYATLRLGGRDYVLAASSYAD